MSNGFNPGMPTNITVTSPRANSFAIATQTVCEQIESWSLRNPLIASLTWMALLFTISLSIHTAAFETNDDVLMSMIVSGTGASTQPDEHMVFSNFVVGLVLKQLYIQIPAIPWYGIYLVGFHYLSQVAVLYCVLKWRYSRAAVCCFLVLFGSVGVQLMSRLQFTSTAVWTTECGIFLVLTGLALRRDGQPRSGLRLLGSGMALMVLGSMVRFDSYIGALAISAIPLMILVWLQDRVTAPAHRIWRMALVAAVLTQVGAFGMQAAHQYYYSRDPAWQEYLTFNPYRIKFNDYCWTKYTEETKPVFDSVRWSANDHEMIRMCFFDDPQVFGRKTLQAIVEGFPWGREAVSLQKMQKWWYEILNNVRLWPIWALIPLQIWWARDRRFAIRHFIVLTLSLDAFIFALMLLKNPPGRVYYPLVAFQGLYTLYLMRCGSLSSETPRAQNSPADLPANEPYDIQSRAIHSHGFITGVFCTFAVMGMCVGQHKAHRDSRYAVKANWRMHADLKRVQPLESDLLVCWGCSFPYEAILPLESNAMLRRVKMLSLGWVQQSPINDARKKQFGIQDLTLSLFDNPNIFLLVKGAELDYYQTYIREHYQTDVTWDHCYEGNEFSLFKPVRSDGDLEAPAPPTTAAVSRWRESRQ